MTGKQEYACSARHLAAYHRQLKVDERRERDAGIWLLLKTAGESIAEAMERLEDKGKERA